MHFTQVDPEKAFKACIQLESDPTCPAYPAGGIKFWLRPRHCEGVIGRDERQG